MYFVLWVWWFCTLHTCISGCNLYSAQTFVLQALQMLMFFWASVFYKNGQKTRVFAAMYTKIVANWSLQPALFIAFFFTSIGYLDQKLWWFERDTSHSLKNHFSVFFQNAHHCNLRKIAVFKNFWGFVSDYVRTITNVCVFIKSWFLSWSSSRTTVFLKLDRCTLTAVM